MTLKQCIKLNSYAVACMQDGRHLESAKASKNALEQLQPCFAVVPNQGEGLHFGEHRQRGDTPQRPPFFTNVSINMDGLVLTDNLFNFCPSIYHISMEGAMEIGLHKLFLILLYNQAAIRHATTLLHVSKNKKNPYQPLMKVFNLYETALNVARAAFQYHDVSEMVGVLAAIANNSGHIASQLHLFEETTAKIDLLVELLALPAASDERAMPVENMRIFYGSVFIFLEGEGLTKAPAA